MAHIHISAEALGITSSNFLQEWHATLRRDGPPIATGVVAAVFGYVCDSIPWPILKVVVGVTGYLGAGACIADFGRSPASTLSSLASSVLAVTAIRHHPSLDIPVSAALLGLFCGQFAALTLHRFVLLDAPWEDGATHWRLRKLQSLAQVVTAIILYHPSRFNGNGFMHLGECDLVSLIAAHSIVLFVAQEFGKRARFGQTGYSLETAYDAVCQLRQNVTNVEHALIFFFTELVYRLKITVRAQLEEWYVSRSAFESLEEFSYDAVPLRFDQIRVLNLERRSFMAPSLLVARLEAVTMDEARSRRYEALSYTWGDSRPSHPILLNGGRFTIGKSLYDFLAARRSIFYKRVV